MNPISPIYSQSASDGVWQRPDHGEFGYSDGDEVENRIASVIAATQDCSVLSSQLRSHIIDWPTRYHLSSQRANILRPLRASLSGSVLEIGSGCGAITRYLGEVARSVTALEGSRRRAHITRLRTRDQGNVEVICDEFSAFETEQRFDAVTLIGVLEYANMFVRSDQAALHMLSKARARLNDDGCLIIAIENQLGLKYWAGAPEDHLGQAMLGLEDKYKPGGVRTYGKQALGDLLKSAGFESVDFLYPFPDYKLPSCVLAEGAFNNPAFDPTPFLVLTAAKDHQLPADSAFCLERVWPVVQANGLAMDLANSFLIVARPRDKSKATAPGDGKRPLAWHFSTQRLPQFCKETVFSHERDDSEVSIVRRPLSSNAEASAASVPGLSHRLEDDTPYAPLPLLSSSLIDIVTRPGWSDQQLADFVLLYAVQLARIGSIDLVQDSRVRWNQPLPGWLFDCIPQNIRVHPDGTCSVFDLEWRLEQDLSFVQLVFRSLWHTVGGLSQIGAHASESRLSMLDIITRTLRLLGAELSTSEAEALVRYELDLQLALSGETTDFEQVWQWLKDGAQRQLNTHERLKERLGQDGALAQWQQHSRNLEQEVHQRDLALQDLRRHCDHLTEQVRRTEESLLLAHQTTQSVVERASSDSLRNSLALHRLTRQLTNSHLVSRSPKSLVKLARDFQHVTRLADSGSSSPRSLNWIAAVHGWRQPKPSVIGLARIDHGSQAEQLMTQSCHWNFPFEWRFSAAHASAAQSAGAIAHQLEIFAHLSTETSEPAGDRNTWLKSLPDRSYLAFPRLLDRSGAGSDSGWPLPDAELLRLAYVALLCDSGLSVVYVGAKAAMQTTQSPAVCPLMVLARPDVCSAQPNLLSFWESRLDAGQVADELARIRSTVEARQQRILVL